MRLIFLLLLFTSFELYAKVTASVDQSKIRYGQSLQLNIKSDNAAGLSPNLSQLKRSFKVVGSSKVSRPYIKNGRRQIKTLWFYILQPRLSGNLTIPVIKVNGEKTNAIKVSVKAIKKAKPSQTKKKLIKKIENAHNIIVKATLSKKKLYPNEILEYHLSINAPREKKGEFQVNAPFIADAIVLPLAPRSTKETTLRGKPRTIHAQSYAIFAEQVAIYQIEPARITYSEPSLQGNPKNVLLKANSLHFEIAPKANQTSLGYWLPSDSISLTQTFDIPNNLKKGDTINRTITLKAQGLDVDSLPLMSTLTHENIRMSLEDVRLDSKVIAGKLIATRSETVSMTFKSSGSMSIEPIDIHWWNTKVDQARVATIQAYSFTIKDPVSPTSTAQQDVKEVITNAPIAHTSPPKALSAKDTATGVSEKVFSDNQLNALIGLLFALLVITTAGWLISTRRKKPSSLLEPKIGS